MIREVTQRMGKNPYIPFLSPPLFYYWSSFHLYLLKNNQPLDARVWCNSQLLEGRGLSTLTTVAAALRSQAKPTHQSLNN